MVRWEPVIVSHRHRFIFVKTHKTAGTSLEISLSRHAGPDDVLTPVAKRDEPVRAELGLAPRNHRGLFSPLSILGLRPRKRVRRALKRLLARQRYYNHMSAQEIRSRVGRKVWDSYFTFCFERNPFDKVVSDYFWVVGAKEHWKGLSFEEYLRRGRFPVDWDKYTIGGSVAVDFVGRFESLAEDLARVCAHVGIEDFDGWLPRLKGGWRDPASKPYRNFVPPAGRAVVERAFRAEIDHFGYEFDRLERSRPAVLP